MTEESIFKNYNEIKKYIKKYYNLNTIKMSKINRGSANIYNIDNKYILKEFESFYKVDIILKEIDIINYLKSKDFYVPNYISTINNEYYNIYCNKIIILEEFINGYTMEPNTGSYKNIIESANILGRLTKCLNNYNKKLPLNLKKLNYNELDINYSIIKYEEIKNMIDRNDSYYNEIYIDCNDKINMLNNISNIIDLSDLNKLTIMNTQGDFSVMQFIYKNDSVIAIIDFVKSSRMPIVWEVIRSYSYIDKDVKNGEFNIDNFIDYVKEFMKYINLTNIDLKLMPYLYLYQLLNSTYGYKEYINTRNKSLIAFAFFRTNLCRYLYNNCKIISNRLMELYIE